MKSDESLFSSDEGKSGIATLLIRANEMASGVGDRAIVGGVLYEPLQ